MAEAVSAVSKAALGIGTIGAGFAAFNILKPLIPYAGGAGAAGVVGLVTVKTDPFLAVGAGVAAGSLVFIPLQAWANLPGSTGAGLAKSCKGVSQLVLGGLGFGIGHQASKNIVVAAAIGAAGAVMAPKFLWNGLVNFYVDVGAFGGKICNQNDPTSTTCARPCDPKTAQEAAKVFLSSGQCYSPESAEMQRWCQAKAKWLSTCPYGARGPEPGSPPVSGGACKVPDDVCSATYPDFSSKGPPTFPKSAVWEAVPCQSSPGVWGTTRGVPLNIPSFVYAFGSADGFEMLSLGVFKCTKQRTVQPLFNGVLVTNRSISLFEAGKTYYIQDVVTLNGLWFCAPSANYVDIQEAEATGTGVTITSPFHEFNFDGSDPHAPSHLAGPYAGKKACAPATCQVTPQGNNVIARVNLNATQPLPSDRSKFKCSKDERVLYSKVGGQWQYKCGKPGESWSGAGKAYPFPAL